MKNGAWVPWMTQSSMTETLGCSTPCAAAPVAVSAPRAAAPRTRTNTLIVCLSCGEPDPAFCADALADGNIWLAIVVAGSAESSLCSYRHLCSVWDATRGPRDNREPPDMLPGHGRYDYSAIDKRKDYSWPDGRRLASHVSPHIAHSASGTGIGTHPPQPTGP